MTNDNLLIPIPRQPSSTGHRATAPWKQVHELKLPTGVAIRIERRGDHRPQYSLSVGRERRDGRPEDRLISYVPVPIEALGSVTVDRSLEALLAEAHNWIHEDALTFEANYVSGLQHREHEKDRRAGLIAPPTRRTGKTERDREKRKNRGAAG